MLTSYTFTQLQSSNLYEAEVMSQQNMRAFVFIAAGWALFASCPAWAGDLIIEISGIASNAGEIGCALFSDPTGFPRDTSRAVQQRWQPAKGLTTTCHFEGLKPGTYAVAVTHDLNGNHRTDSNLLGIPTEDWGVSKNVRPSFRAPSFEEAAFAVSGASPATITVRLAR